MKDKIRVDFPDVITAEEILAKAEMCNIGNWGNHSRNVALCAKKTAEACSMDSQKAYVLGLLHDIVNIERRMLDVKNRYGYYPQEKWYKNLELKAYFEKLSGKSIYRIVGIE